MPDKKITELTGYTPPINTDVLPVVDITAGITKKVTWANIKATLKTYFDGLYAAIGAGAEATQKSYVLGENFLQGEAGWILVSSPADAAEKTSTGNYSEYGTAATPKCGQTFTSLATDSIGIGIVNFTLFKTGTPTDNIYCKIYASDKTTLLATSDAVDGSTLSTIPGAEVTFTFSTPPAITASTVYFLELSRASLDDSNYYTARGGGTYAGGTASRYQSDTWGDIAYDLYFEVLLAERTRVYLTDADESGDYLLPIGYANAAGSAEDSVAFNTGGVATISPTDTPAVNDIMYLSNTAGEVQTTGGSTSVKVGRMISPTKMLIIPPPL
jgi:hypothetical protein